MALFLLIISGQQVGGVITSVKGSLLRLGVLLRRLADGILPIWCSRQMVGAEASLLELFRGYV